jgi:hypothetical protein
MIMTEPEAKEKWCPQSMVSQAGEHSYNRCHDWENTFIPLACKCIGSRCMWWVWHDGEEADAKRRGRCKGE